MKKSSIRGNFTGRENARKRAAKKRRKQREAKRRKLLRQQKRMQQPTKKKVVKLLRSIDWSLIPVIGKWIFQIALTILIAFVCVWYFGQRVSVVGDSMKPVLENGDIVLANRMLRRVRDFAEVKSDGTITDTVADQALQALEIDHLGLDPVDRRMLRAIIENYGGGPVGLETLAATIGEESVTLEDVYEPYLMQLGFLTRTPRGRCVTKKAYDHLHMAYLGQEQMTL